MSPQQQRREAELFDAGFDEGRASVGGFAALLTGLLIGAASASVYFLFLS
jgi:hypothetical protein